MHEEGCTISAIKLIAFLPIDKNHITCHTSKNIKKIKEIILNRGKCIYDVFHYNEIHSNQARILIAL